MIYWHGEHLQHAQRLLNNLYLEHVRRWLPMKDIFETLNAPSVTRRFVRLKDGETAPETLQFYVLPEGYRLETDDELRARMQQEWELNMKIEEFDQALGDLIKVICPPNVS